MSNIKFRLVGGLHKYYYECTICVIHKGKDRGLPCITQRRRWVFKSKGADKGHFLSESVMNFSNCQTNMPNHYLKLEFLKLHFVCFCFAADFQANPTDISSKKAGIFKRRV